MTNQTSIDKLRRVSSAYQETCVLAAAGELDLFTAILQNGSPLTAERLAAFCGVDCRALTVLLDALAAAGYLVKNNGSYAVAGEYVELLDSRSPSTYVPMIRHLANVQRAWTQLARTVKTGTRTDTPPSILGADEDNVSFIWAMNSVAGTLVEPTIESLRNANLLTFKNFIDIGGASGTYTQAFLRALPESRAAIFDLPVGIAAARKRFIGSEFEQRVTLIEGDIFNNDFPTGFDFAWISAIIHQFDRAESCALYRKTWDSLKSGGVVAVRDFVMSSDRTSPRDGALFGINMLVETPHGMVYTFDEIKSDLESVGFENVKLAVPLDTMSAVVTATKK
ncbi:MAG: hypothetical protein LBU65_04915 [Planctomycetaceae bacterium]|jgi:hypothetical protein|nr:hypothetical protein [Planctomycetaceae bacterium]